MFLISLATFLLAAATTHAQDAEAIFQRGNELQSEGKYKQALIFIDSSLRIDSSMYQRYHLRSNINERLGKLDDAIIDITKCIERCNCPTRKYHVARYYQTRARLQVLNNGRTAAMDDINKSIMANPTWEAWSFRSNLYLHQGNLQQALVDINKSIRMNNNEATTLMARGDLRIKLGDIKGACEDLRQVANWGFEQYEPWLLKNCSK